MRHARGELRAECEVRRQGAVWVVSRAPLAPARELVAQVEISSPDCNRVTPSATWSRLTLSVTKLERLDKTKPLGASPVIRIDVDAYVGGGLYRLDTARWSPSAWTDAGLLIAWSGFPVQGFEVHAWQESGDPAAIGLHFVMDGEGAPASLVRGTNVAAVP